MIWLTSLKDWRPAMPGVSMSGFGDILRRGSVGLWRSFWAVFDQPMTYPIVVAIAVAMFVLGFGQGRHGVGALRETLTDTRSELAVVQSHLASAQINETAARRTAREALDRLAAIKPAAEAVSAPAPSARPALRKPVRKPAPEPAKFWPFGSP